MLQGSVLSHFQIHLDILMQNKYYTERERCIVEIVSS